MWTGEDGIRVYAAGNPGLAKPEHLIRQVRIQTDPAKRLLAARELYRLMFDEPAPVYRSIDQLRGAEGSKVKALYLRMAKERGIPCQGRERTYKDPINLALSIVNSCLYGVTEAVLLSLGYSPSIGVVHSGDARSFVYDISDTVKFKSVVPLAFDAVEQAIPASRLSHILRPQVRELFRSGLIDQLIDNTLSVLDASDRP